MPVQTQRTAYRLEYSDYYADKTGIDFKPDWRRLDICELKLDDAFLAFEAGSSSSSALASAILTALFERDFSGDGKHWDHNGQRINQVDSADALVEAFDASESSTWDHKDIYAVAKSSGQVQINKTEKWVRVQDYKFYCSG